MPIKNINLRASLHLWELKVSVHPVSGCGGCPRCSELLKPARVTWTAAATLWLNSGVAVNSSSLRCLINGFRLKQKQVPAWAGCVPAAALCLRCGKGRCVLPQSHPTHEKPRWRHPHGSMGRTNPGRCLGSSRLPRSSKRIGDIGRRVSWVRLLDFGSHQLFLRYSPSVFQHGKDASSEASKQPQQENWHRLHHDNKSEKAGNEPCYPAEMPENGKPPPKSPRSWRSKVQTTQPPKDNHKKPKWLDEVSDQR